MDSYISALLADIEYQIDFFKIEEIPTAYIGGGTPSVLGHERIRNLACALKTFPAFKPAEFTIEANPESLSEEFLSVCLESGINRISLGIQSFHEPSRRAVNRCAGSASLCDKLALAARYFPLSFSADIIAGLPLQSEEILLRDMETLLAYRPSHVSLYSLTVEEQTALEENLKNGAVSLPHQDEADALWLAGRDALIKAGYEHYEVSNFALPGKRCLHNIRYWRMENWIGAGPAASGTMITEGDNAAAKCYAKRFTYPACLDAYLNAMRPFPELARCEELDTLTLMKDSLLMGFRYCGGPEPESFKRRFGRGIEDCIPQTLERWKNRGTMLFLNNFLSDAFDELDCQ